VTPFRLTDLKLPEHFTARQCARIYQRLSGNKSVPVSRLPEAVTSAVAGGSSVDVGGLAAVAAELTSSVKAMNDPSLIEFNLEREHEYVCEDEDEFNTVSGRSCNSHTVCSLTEMELLGERARPISQFPHPKMTIIKGYNDTRQLLA
jgi:hypothetical protein